MFHFKFVPGRKAKSSTQSFPQLILANCSKIWHQNSKCPTVRRNPGPKGYKNLRQNRCKQGLLKDSMFCQNKKYKNKTVLN